MLPKVSTNHIGNPLQEGQSLYVDTQPADTTEMVSNSVMFIVSSTKIWLRN